MLGIKLGPVPKEQFLSLSMQAYLDPFSRLVNNLGVRAFVNYNYSNPLRSFLESLLAPFRP